MRAPGPLLLLALTVLSGCARTPAVVAPLPESTPAAPAGPVPPAPEAVATHPLPYDPQGFAAHPEPYLAQVVPERAQEAASPAPGVPLLLTPSPADPFLPHQGTGSFTVQAAPGAPVSVWCGDLLVFGNGQVAQTLRADAQGSVTFAVCALPGCVGPATIHVASPAAAGVGSVEFTVRSQEKNP